MGPRESAAGSDQDTELKDQASASGLVSVSASVLATEALAWVPAWEAWARDTYSGSGTGPPSSP